MNDLGELRPGARLGSFAIEASVHRTASSTIFRARAGSGALVALKVASGPLGFALLAIRREARALSRVDHPGVARLVDTGLRDGEPWLATRFVDGVPASQWVEASLLRADHAARAIRVFLALADALRHLHERGVVHGDLKPDNFLVVDPERPVLLDLGLSARWAHREELPTAAELEASGSWGYIAPEEMGEARSVDARGDVYALGAVLFELWTGKRAFEGPTAGELLARQLRGVAPRLEGGAGGLEDVLARMLSPRPEDRPSSIDEVIEAVARARDVVPPARSSGSRVLRSELIGRDGELGRVVAFIEGGSGLCLVRGESGIGKTRLMTEALRYALRAGISVITGACETSALVASSQGGPLHPFVPTLRSIVERLQRADMTAARVRLAEDLAVLAEHDASVREAFVDLPPAPALLPEAARLRICSALEAVLQDASPGGTLLCVLDDVHAIDDLSLAFLLHVTRASRGRIAVLAALRSDELGAAVKRALAAASPLEIDLAPLADADVTALTRRALGPGVAADLQASVASRAGGNPFFAVELLDQILRLGPSAAKPGATQEGALPATLAEVLRRRVESSPAFAQAVARAAAVVGRDVDRDLVAALAPRTDEGLLELVERAVLQTGGGGQLRFRHDKIRETVYAGLGADERRRLHGRAAEHLAQRPGAELHARAIAHHYDQADCAAQAIDWHERAAARARATYANEDVLRHLERALELAAAPSVGPVAPGRMASWHRHLAEAAMNEGTMDASEPHATAAVELLGARAPDAGASAGIGLALELGRMALDAVRPSRPISEEERAKRLELSGALSQLATVVSFGNQFLRSSWAATRAYRLVRPLGPTPLLVRTHTSFGAFLGLAGMRALAERRFAEARAMASAIDDADALLWSTAVTGYYAVLAARFDLARQSLEQAEALSRRVGHLRRNEECLTNLARLHFHLGDLERSHAYGVDAARSGERRGDRQTLQWGLSDQARARLFAGRAGEAAELLRRARLHLTQTSSKVAPITMCGFAALAAYETGDLDGARAEARASIEGSARSTRIAIYAMEGCWPAFEVVRALRRIHPNDPELRVLHQRALATLRRFASFSPVVAPFYWIATWHARADAGDEKGATRARRKAVREARRLGMGLALAVAEGRGRARGIPSTLAG